MTKAETERASIVAFLRAGGEHLRGRWYSWDSEMAGYAKSFADRIEQGTHASPAQNMPAQYPSRMGRVG